MKEFTLNQTNYRTDGEHLEVDVRVPILVDRYINNGRDIDGVERGCDYREWFPLWNYTPLKEAS